MKVMPSRGHGPEGRESEVSRDAFDDVVTALAGPASVVHGVTHARVLRAIARHTAGGVRRDLARELRVSPGTVSKAVLLAKKERLVEEKEALALRPGRPIVPLTLSPTGFAMIGVAVIAGSTRPNQLLGVIIGLDGALFSGFDKAWTLDIDDERDPDGTLLLGHIEGFLGRLIDKFEDIRAAWPGDSADRPRLLGCGVNLSGHVDHERGIIHSTGWGEPTDDWEQGLGPELAKRLDVTVTVDNDVNSLAVRLNLRPYEEKDDPGRSYALLAVLDHGVGGALVLNHRTRRGHDGLAGEAGHLPAGSVIHAQPDDDTDPPWTLDDVPRCHCERTRPGPARGHVQAFAAPDSIVARAATMQLIDGRERDDAEAGDPKGDLAAKLSAYPRSNRAVSRLFHQGGVALGRAVISAINWVNPGRIVIYLPAALAETNPYLAGSCYGQALRAELKQSAFSVDYEKDRLIPKTVPATEMKERLAAAAAYLAFARLLEKIGDAPDQRWTH